MVTALMLQLWKKSSKGLQNSQSFGFGLKFTDGTDTGTDLRFLEWLCTVSSCSILAVSRRISASSSRCVWSTCWQSRAKVVAISLGATHTVGKLAYVAAVGAAHSRVGLAGWDGCQLLSLSLKLVPFLFSLSPPCPSLSPAVA